MTSVVPDGGGFRVLLTGGRTIRSRRLLVTTGLTDVLPDVPGLADRWARDVLHCPYCHGHEVRDQQFGVVGGAWRRPLRPDRPTVDPRPRLLHPSRSADGRRAERTGRPRDRRRRGTIERLVDEDHLRGVGMADGSIVPRDALFVPPRFVPRSHLLADLGCATDEDGWVTADGTGRTSHRSVGGGERDRPARL